MTAPVQGQQAPLPAGRRTRVLVVEDNKDLAESMTWVLSELGYEVHVAVHGQQGLDEALRLRPDAVIVDLGLRLLDGLALGRQVRAALPGAVMVAMSGYAEPNFEQRALASGFDRYLVKPMDLDVLLQALETCRREA